jgi:hypothetical protein
MPGVRFRYDNHPNLLKLNVPEQLGDLLRSCEECLPGCCDIDAYDLPPDDPALRLSQALARGEDHWRREVGHITGEGSHALDAGQKARGIIMLEAVAALSENSNVADDVKRARELLARAKRRA